MINIDDTMQVELNRCFKTLYELLETLTRESNNPKEKERGYAAMDKIQERRLQEIRAKRSGLLT